MTFSTLLPLTALLLVVAFVWLRVEPKRRAVANWFLLYPVALCLFIYAWFFSSQRLTVGVSVAVAAGVVGVWWFVYGSYLPSPTSDNISVWGQEAKKPSVVAAEAQAEVERLKKEKEELEKELERLKEEKEKKDTR